jgi:hypothetical protein
MVTSSTRTPETYLADLPPERREAAGIPKVILETERWFRERFANSGRKLNMGKSCVRFRNLDDLPLEIIGGVISRLSPEMLIARYEAARTR